MLRLLPLAVTLVMFLPPAPGGLAPDLGFLIWQGALPWSLPTTPSTTITLTTPTITPPDFSANYDTNLTLLDAEYEDWEDVFDSFDTTLSTLETTIAAPGSQGDFDPGITPDGSPTTIYGMVDDLGTSIGTVLGYARAFKAFDLNSSGGFFSLLLIAFGWIFFNLAAKTVLGVLSDLLNWVWKIWEAIPFIN